MMTIEILKGPNQTADEEGWEHFAYELRLHYDGRTMDTPWKQGVGITDAPNAQDVAEAMFSDASTVTNCETFEEWAGDLGYDADSRKAEAIYKAVQDQTEKLRELLGDDFDHYAEASDPETAARLITR